MSWVDIDMAKYSIGFMKDVYNLELIQKGYSGDIKFVFTKNDKRYLIRFNKMNQFDRVMTGLTKSDKLLLVASYMNKAFENHVRCPKVFDYGVLPQHGVTYIITSFLEGEMAGTALKQMNSKGQYEVGFDLGKDLNRLHKLDFKSPEVNWADQLLQPYNNKMDYYNNNRAQVKFKLDEKIERDLVDYISKHEYLLKDREIRLIHNDVHTDNIIINNGKYNGLIDFNELSYGDPIFEHKYLRLPDVINFPSFSKGVVDGYFNNNVPELFWKLTYLYNALAILTYLPMPNIYTEEEIKDEIDWNIKSYGVYSQYKELIPRWYTKS